MQHSLIAIGPRTSHHHEMLSSLVSFSSNLVSVPTSSPNLQLDLDPLYLLL